MKIYKLMVLLNLILLLILIGNAYLNKSKTAVLTGQITLTNGAGSTNLDYPTGFTQSNCVPIAGGTRYSSSLDRIAFGNIQSSSYTGVYLHSTTVGFSVGNPSGVGPSGTYDFKIVLLRID